MAKKINEKTSGISLAGFQARDLVPKQSAEPTVTVGQAPSPALHGVPVGTNRVPSRNYTGAGIFMSAITGKDEISKELAEVQAQLDVATREAERFAGADLVRNLAASCIRPSRWANRSEASFGSKDFENLKLEIENAGGNIQPIKVRPLLALPGQYEIVFGHRRHRACVELGLPVRALIEELSDVDLFAQMDRENRQRVDLRPYEQGVMYAKALEEGLFPSLRKMAETLGVDAGNASKAIALARLPAKVLAAFASPLDLQQAWASALSTALQKDPDHVLNRASQLAQISPRLPAVKVFKALLQEDEVPSHASNSSPQEIKGRDGKAGKIGFNAKNQVFEITLSGFAADQQKAIEKAIKVLLS